MPELTSTIVDAVIGIVVLLSALFAYSRGFTREVATLAIWGLSIVAALAFYPMVEAALVDVKDFGEYNKWIAIVLTFVLALVILTILGGLLTSVAGTSALRPIDKGLGFLFGIARGLLLLAILWLMFEGMNPAVIQDEAIQTSYGGKIVADTVAALKDVIPDEMPPFLQSAYEDFFDKAPGASTGTPVNELREPNPVAN